MLYYSKRIQTEVSKGKRLIGQSPGEVSCCPLPVKFHGLHSPATMCETTYKVLPTREAHTSLGIQGLYRGVSHIGISTCVVVLRGLQPPQTSQRSDKNTV